MKMYLVQYMTEDSDFWKYRMFPVDSREDAMKDFARECKEKDYAVRIWICERMESKKK